MRKQFINFTAIISSLVLLVACNGGGGGGGLSYSIGGTVSGFTSAAMDVALTLIEDLVGADKRKEVEAGLVRS